MKLTEENIVKISRNNNVLELVRRLLNEGQSLIASDQPKGQYVCSCDIGTVQRM